ncbi:hypothetical protein [Streptomyces sp. NBC_00299]|nr:hypothetical protein [Streptomyces sp. NBC_00299]
MRFLGCWLDRTSLEERWGRPETVRDSLADVMTQPFVVRGA